MFKKPTRIFSRFHRTERPQDHKNRSNKYSKQMCCTEPPSEAVFEKLAELSLKHEVYGERRNSMDSDSGGTPATEEDTHSKGNGGNDSISMSTISFNGDDEKLDGDGQAKSSHLPIKIIGEGYSDEISSQSSASVDVFQQITTLQEKLRIQEETKVELLNQCVILQKKAVESEQVPPVYMNMLREENERLKKKIQLIERNFENDMGEIVDKMKYMNAELASRDDKIHFLEEELNLLGCGELYLDSAYDKCHIWIPMTFWKKEKSDG